MFGDVQTQDGPIPFSLFVMVAASHLPLAASNNNDYIDVLYAGQIALASKDVWTANHPKQMVIKFGQKMEGTEAVTDRNLKDLGCMKLMKPAGS